jgi:hypothetical protein
MRLSRRSVGAFLAAALLIVSLAPGALAAAEDSLLSKINEERGSRGLPALASHWDLVDDAQAHSQAMMSADNLHHNPNLGSVTTGWLSLGENVGVGPSVSSIHTAFMNSPPHRGNVLGDFTHVGIGAIRESDNRLWITVVFMKASDAATTTTSIAPAPTSTTPPATTTGGPPPVTGAPVSTAAPTRPTTATQGETVGETVAEVSAADAGSVVAPPVRVRLRHSPRPL